MNMDPVPLIMPHHFFLLILYSSLREHLQIHQTQKALSMPCSSSCKALSSFSASWVPTCLSKPFKYHLPMKSSLAPARELVFPTYDSPSVCSYFCYRTYFVHSFICLPISICSSLGSELLQAENTFYFVSISPAPSTMSATCKDIIREWSPSVRGGCSGTELDAAESQWL